MSPLWDPSVQSTQGLVMGPGTIQVSRSTIADGATCQGAVGTHDCPNGTNYEHVPDYDLGGQQTLVTQPIAPVITANKLHIMPGDTVTFTASVDWTTDWSIPWNEGWGWVPDDGSAPQGMGCGTPVCRYRVPKRGHSVVGIMAGSLHFVPVLSPTVKVWSPGDSLGHLVASCSDPGARGSVVTCSVYAADSTGTRLDYDMTQEASSGTGSTAFSITDGLQLTYDAGGTHTWTGPAVTPTQVTFTAKVGGATKTGVASFAPTARPWTDYVMSAVIEIVGLDPGHRMVEPIQNNTVAGVYDVHDPTMFGTASAVTLQQGPDSGLSYLDAQPRTPIPTIYIHADLLEVTVVAGSAFNAQDAAYQAWIQFLDTGTHASQQADFDSTDTPIVNDIGCTLVFP